MYRPAQAFPERRSTTVMAFILFAVLLVFGPPVAWGASAAPAICDASAEISTSKITGDSINVSTPPPTLLAAGGKGGKTTSCTTGFADCNGDRADGCETNLMTSISNCGTCNNVCSAANATPSCTNGGCGISACNSGFADCNGNFADGCETNTNSDSRNCGACGQACSSGQSCSAGKCL